MNLTVTLEGRFVRTPDKKIWTHVGFAHSFWQRYLEVFDNVNVVARIRDVSSVPSDWKRADGPQVSFTSIPYYVGPWQYILRFPQYQRSIMNLNIGSAVIMRVSSQIANTLEPVLRKNDHPYGVEVVGDPHDVFAPGAVKHPARFFFRWWFSRRLKIQCAYACGTAYVTEHMLQHRYPPSPKRYSTHYSSIELKDNAFSVPRNYNAQEKSVMLISVGTLAQLYKAPDILIKAVARNVNNGIDIRLVLVGGGQYEITLKNLAKKLGIDAQVTFTGQLPSGTAVRRQLDSADLFVLPSHQEGLPRAMIEAMARGLPCIGSTVGGIPELLPSEDMVPPGDVNALAQKIKEVVSNPVRMTKMSKRNLDKAREYHEDILRGRRIEFYEYLKNRTEEWLKTREPT